MACTKSFTEHAINSMIINNSDVPGYSTASTYSVIFGQLHSANAVISYRVYFLLFQFYNY